MIPVRGYEGQKVAVLGLGRSGLATAAALQAGGAIPLVWDDNAPARALAADKGYSLVDLTRNDALRDGVSALIASPGIPHLYPAPHPAVAHALRAGVPVDNDIGLFFRSFATPEWSAFERAPRIIAVTGSNGKSTTSALLHHILQEAGKPCQLAGNIGRAVLDMDPAHDGEVVVLELSSYQTELARSLTPDIAVFTNLSPDHLERHGGIGGYFAAKRRLFAEGGPDRSVIGVEEVEGRFLANQMAVGGADDQVIRISTLEKLTGAGWSVFARKGFLSEYRKGRQVGAIDLRNMPGLPGVHNHQNACAAYAAVRTLGVAPKVIENALRSFKGLPHRCQIIGERGGVVFVNDSKATNADSAAKSLQAFERVRWIAGGQAKAGGISALAPHLGHVAKAYLIGQSAAEFAESLGNVPHELCETMEKAVYQAAKDAESGDVVLLAPAAASFDQYDNFEQRGDEFVRIVSTLA